GTGKDWTNWVLIRFNPPVPKTETPASSRNVCDVRKNANQSGFVLSLGRRVYTSEVATPSLVVTFATIARPWVTVGVTFGSRTSPLSKCVYEASLSSQGATLKTSGF